MTYISHGSLVDLLLLVRGSRELLIQFLDKHCRTENQKAEQLGESSSSAHRVVSAYDFVYLPLDLRYASSQSNCLLICKH